MQNYFDILYLSDCYLKINESSIYCFNSMFQTEIPILKEREPNMRSAAE